MVLGIGGRDHDQIDIGSAQQRFDVWNHVHAGPIRMNLVGLRTRDSTQFKTGNGRNHRSMEGLTRKSVADKAGAQGGWGHVKWSSGIKTDQYAIITGFAKSAARRCAASSVNVGQS
jgi:hypothetical protein